MIDSTGASRLRDFIQTCQRHGTQVVLSGLQSQPERILRDMHVLNGANDIHVVQDYPEALDLANKLAAQRNADSTR
jgi:SulP family sulfate permease